MNRIREVLEDPGSNALDFVHDFKLNLFSDEIVVFTPNGEMRNLPVRCHSAGFRLRYPLPDRRQCIGAKVNHKLVPSEPTLAQR